MSRTIVHRVVSYRLKTGGTLTISVAVKILDLEGEDLEFIVGLTKQIREARQ